MILRIYDKAGNEIAKEDVSGSVWRIAHVGFVNDSEIQVKFHTSGQGPFQFTLSDYFGIERCKGIIDFSKEISYKDVAGAIGAFRPGNLTIDLTPLIELIRSEKTDESK